MATTWSNPAAAFVPQQPRVRVAEAACTTGTEAYQPKGPYAAGTAYALGDVVTYGGVPYVSLQAANTGHQPDLAGSAAWWASLAAAGLDLTGLQAVGVALELAAAGNIAAGATLQFYLLNPATGQINRAPDLDVPLQAIASGQGLVGLKIDGPAGRLYALPNGVGAACNVFLNGSLRSGAMFG
jgi:hypothetical protein